MKPDIGSFAVTRQFDRLYVQGWPYLRVLTDEPIERGPAIRAAREVLEAIDPCLPTHLPRDLARRYLRGYIVRKPYSKRAAVERAIGDDDAPIDRAWLAEILAKKIGPSRVVRNDETYVWRLAEVVFLFEAFLGTRPVAEALVEHLVGARENPRWWGTKFFRDHGNAAARRLVPILGWLRLRMTPREWRAVIRPLAGEQPALPNYVADLSTLLGDTGPLDGVRNREWIAMQRREREWLVAYLEDRSRKGGYWEDPQIYYVVGEEALDQQPVDRLKRLPKWMQLRVVDQFGTIRSPRVNRVIEALVASRSAGEAAARWLANRGTEAAPPATRSPKELQAELAEMIDGMGARLQAQGDDRQKEREILDESFARYCDIRAALDDPIPEAYFTHHLAEVSAGWDATRKTVERWMNIAVEAASNTKKAADKGTEPAKKRAKKTTAQKPAKKKAKKTTAK